MKFSAEQVNAVFLLAQKLFEYGQFDRVLSLLDLYEWMTKETNESRELRLLALIGLEDFEKAKTLLGAQKEIATFDLSSKVFWGLGEKDVGDELYIQHVKNSIHNEISN